MTSPSEDTVEWGVEVRLSGNDEWIRYYGWFTDEHRADRCLRWALSDASLWGNARKVKRTSRVEVVE